MPKLVQDGVVIMSHNQPQNKHYLFEQDFYPNNLVVKHIDAPSLCPTGHSNESQRNRSGSRSREVLYRESPRHSLTQQYSMQRITDEYNLQGRCKTREMYFENGRYVTIWFEEIFSRFIFNYNSLNCIQMY